MFTLKRVNTDPRSLYLGVEKLEQVNSFKFLGVELKANLGWILMRSRVVKKARSRMALLSKAVVDGLAPDTCLVYGSHVLDPCWSILLKFGVYPEWM